MSVARSEQKPLSNGLLCLTLLSLRTKLRMAFVMANDQNADGIFTNQAVDYRVRKPSE